MVFHGFKRLKVISTGRVTEANNLPILHIYFKWKSGGKTSPQALKKHLTHYSMDTASALKEVYGSTTPFFVSRILASFRGGKSAKGSIILLVEGTYQTSEVYIISKETLSELLLDRSWLLEELSEAKLGYKIDYERIDDADIFMESPALLTMISKDTIPFLVSSVVLFLILALADYVANNNSLSTSGITYLYAAGISLVPWFGYVVYIYTRRKGRFEFEVSR